VERVLPHLRTLPLVSKKKHGRSEICAQPWVAVVGLGAGSSPTCSRSQSPRPATHFSTISSHGSRPASRSDADGGSHCSPAAGPAAGAAAYCARDDTQFLARDSEGYVSERKLLVRTKKPPLGAPHDCHTGCGGRYRRDTPYTTENRLGLIPTETRGVKARTFAALFGVSVEGTLHGGGAVGKKFDNSASAIICCMNSPSLAFDEGAEQKAA